LNFHFAHPAVADHVYFSLFFLSDLLTTQSCARVQRFSNPYSSYNSKAIGTNQENNALQINNVRKIVSRYFDSCSADIECEDGNPCTTDTCPSGWCLNEFTCPLLVTTWDAGYAFHGNMFKVKAKNDILITQFHINLKSTGPVECQVYTRAGNYESYEQSPSAWDMVLQTVATGMGEGAPTYLLFDLPLALGANTTQAFYVTTTGQAHLAYTLGGQEGRVFSENDDLAFYEGLGVGYPFGNGIDEFYTPRIFNGAIGYELQSSSRPSSLPSLSSQPSSEPSSEPSLSSVPSKAPVVNSAAVKSAPVVSAAVKKRRRRRRRKRQKRKGKKKKAGKV
jgi:hypothetical protein